MVQSPRAGEISQAVYGREGWQNGYCTGLENRRPQGHQGSNPWPSVRCPGVDPHVRAAACVSSIVWHTLLPLGTAGHSGAAAAVRSPRHHPPRSGNSRRERRGPSSAVRVPAPAPATTPSRASATAATSWCTRAIPEPDSPRYRRSASPTTRKPTPPPPTSVTSRHAPARDCSCSPTSSGSAPATRPCSARCVRASGAASCRRVISTASDAPAARNSCSTTSATRPSLTDRARGRVGATDRHHRAKACPIAVSASRAMMR